MVLLVIDDVRVTVITPQSIIVTWDQPSSTIVTGYLVSYSTNALYTSGGNVMVTDRSTTTATLTNLEENTLYTIFVQIVINGLLGLSRDVVSVTTLTDGKCYII